jgi:hypothetical protein
VVAGVSAALGVNVATVPPPVRINVPETALPPVTWMMVVPLTTDRSKVTETVVPRATPAEFATGVRAVTAGAGTVENDHDSGVIDAPAALVAPEATTEYVVVALKGADGVKVAVFVAALYAVDPATLPPGPVTTIVAPVTAWLKPTATVAFIATLTAPEAGVCEVTVGAAAVVKLHETGAMPALPDAVEPDTVAVYVVFGASGAFGVNVAVVLAAFSVRVPGTGVLPATTWKVVEPLSTARSKPTDTVVPSATPVAPDAGARDVTAGDGAIVVNAHDTSVIDAPAALVAPETVTV